MFEAFQTTKVAHFCFRLVRKKYRCPDGSRESRLESRFAVRSVSRRHWFAAIFRNRTIRTARPKTVRIVGCKICFKSRKSIRIARSVIRIARFETSKVWADKLNPWMICVCVSLCVCACNALLLLVLPCSEATGQG